MKRSVFLGIIILAVFLGGCTQTTSDSYQTQTTLPIIYPNDSPPYWISIDPVSSMHVGDKFSIQAKTNLPANETVLICIHNELYPKDFRISHYYGGTVMDRWQGEKTRVNGTNSGDNSILFNADVASFMPDDYRIEIASMNRSVSGTTVFSILSTSQKP